MTATPFPRPDHFRPLRWFLFALAGVLGLAAVPAAHAQLEMSLTFTRHQYILYEPILATVTITNNSGHDIELADTGGKPWLNMEVTTVDDTLISPYDPDFHLRSVAIPAGQTIKRQLDLTPLFPIRDLGEHHVRADLYFAEMDHYFYSNYVTFDLTSGKTIWRETVGVPGAAGNLREVSLLTHQLNDRLLLYVRVRDANGDAVYVTHSIGRLVITGREPQIMLDNENTLHVLHEAVPGSYLYTVVSLNGDRLDQQVYERAGNSRPILAKSAGGSVDVRGGQVQASPAAVARGADGGALVRQPKLSDRPAGLPLPAKTPGE